MPPRQWEPIVADFSRVQKLVHLAMRLNEFDAQAMVPELFAQKKQSYVDALTIQAANAGCPGRKATVSPVVLSAMMEEARVESAGIANTYNYDLALAIRYIRDETPTANRHVYAKRLGEWDTTRAEWKSKQIMLWNTMKWHDKAVATFIEHNPEVVTGGYVIIKPQNTAVCDVCRYWVNRGKVSIEEASEQEWPAHLNCPHYKDVHYGKVADCSKLRVGTTLEEFWQDIEAAGGGQYS